MVPSLNNRMLQASSWNCFNNPIIQLCMMNIRKGESHLYHENLLFSRTIFLFLIFFATYWQSVRLTNCVVYARCKDTNFLANHNQFDDCP